MSNLRRNLVIGNSEEGGSWYRICDGGIYTTTDAYINTLYKDFANRYFEYCVDCKVLSEDITMRRLCGAWSDTYAAYNAISFSDKNNTYANVLYGAHTYTSDSNINIAKPYINKKVRATVPYNQSGYYYSNQFYENGQLGTIVYSTGDNNNHNTKSIPYSMYLFARNLDGSADGFSNNIVIYEALGKYNGVLKYHLTACQLTQNISADLAWDNQPYSKNEYGMYDSISGKFFGNANSSGYFIENFD